MHDMMSIFFNCNEEIKDEIFHAGLTPEIVDYRIWFSEFSRRLKKLKILRVVSCDARVVSAKSTHIVQV